ncbi:hypothetical protein M9Y10_040706 [Tritrichomonas musculus]|uniref:Uncharacterized protein n=1 Tax=Tritrichomonas musculus TaxID=1915356 RepID=A0ABR2K3C6_9EUKA
MFLFIFFVSSRLDVKQSKNLRYPLRRSSFKQIANTFLKQNVLFDNKEIRLQKNKLMKERKLKDQDLNEYHEQLLDASSSQSLDFTTESKTSIEPTETLSSAMPPLSTPISTPIAVASITPIPEETSSISNLSPLTTSIPPTPSLSSNPTSLATSTPTPTLSSIPTSIPTPNPTSTPVSTPTPIITKTQNQIDEDEDEERKQRYFLIALCATFFFLLIVVLTLYLYCRRKEEEQNPEYTRAILGDDAFEFSQLQTF